MSRYLTVAKRAARRAGSTLVLRHATFRRSTAHYKERNELVTTEDARSERNILSELRQNFPDHTFISEEAGLRQGSGDYVWYVDPLDGTSNYVMGNPLYGISIALAHRKELILGVLYFPEIKRMFWAEQGGGAYFNGKKTRVSNVSSLRKANHTFCHGKRPQDLKKAFELYHKFLPQHIRLRHLGSAAFELSQLIMGGTDSYISVGVRPWDIAAGICIVREAGGKVTDGNGKPWHFGAQTMIATNGKIHRALIEFINT